MKRKIKWINVIKLVVFIFCISMILHDVIMLSIGNGFTSLGLLTFILFLGTASMIYEDFEEQIKSKESYLPRHADLTNK